MGEIRRLRVDGRDWTDVATGERGQLARPAGRDGEMLVEMEFTRSGWVVVREIGSPSPPPSQHSAAPDVSLSRRPAAGQVRSAVSFYPSRSASAGDAEFDAKLRPCVVVWVDGVHAGVRFVFASGSARRRWGGTRRVLDWQQCSLRKPSLVSGEIHVVACSELGALIGLLSERDRQRLCEMTGTDLSPSS